jgi:hypothetical protein
MKCKIVCPVHKDEAREWEISSEGRVWPCCYFANGWEKKGHKNDETDLLFSDSEIRKLFNEDTDWNSLNTYSLEEIVDHEIFWTHIWKQGWESDNPPPMCEKECGVRIDNASGKELGGSDLRAKSHFKK